MQTLRKKTSPCKYRNDPGRFFGDGVQFKAKLIGILEVGEARGDRMCQEALQDLKMAIRAAGEHKQRITIHVTIDGLRLRDEKTGDSLYHHPVHKISFIAQDMTDSRAFGYIFGSPDSGHRFFGIKTDKAASQVVLAMRDLFQVVFELKKKEIELARQQIQSKSIHDHQLASLSSLKTAAATSFNARAISGSLGGSTLSILGSMGEPSRGTASNRLGVNLDNKGAAKEMSPESVADLVDLEQELSSLQRGITQMERITPNEPGQPSVAGASRKAASEDDPFGDSFTNFPTYNLLPPPESGRSRHKPTKATDSAMNQPVTTATPTVSNSQNVTLSSLLSPAPVLGTSPGCTLHGDDDDSWLHELDQHNDVFDTSKAGTMGMSVSLPIAPLAPSESTSTPTQQLSESNSALVDVEAAAACITNAQSSCGNAIAGASASGNVDITSSSPIQMMDDGQSQAAANAAVKSDAFTDLDPLGTGRTRPYVDKKYFFQELKNPPKKVLNDLSGGGNGTVDITATGVHYTAASAVVDEFLNKEGLFEDALTGSLDVQDEQIQQIQSSQQQQQLQQPQHSLATPLNITNTTHTSGITGLQSALNTNKSKFIATNNANASSATAATTTTLLIGVLAPQPTPSTVNICTCTISSTKYTSTAASNVVVTRLTNINQQQLGTCSNNSLLTTSTYSTNFATANSNLRIHHYQPTLTSAPTSSSITTTNIPTNLHLNHYTLDSTSTSAVGVAGPTGGAEDVVMMPRDTDPFSPTRKKSDPFQEGGDVFSKLDPFEFEFNNGGDPANLSTSPTADADETGRSADVFNGPLQVNLPPESSLSPTPAQPLSTAAQWRADVARLERQMSEPVAAIGNGNVISANSTVRSRPTPSGQLSNVGQPSSVFKQQTAEVISSISNKKMPHLFGQARFSKRESNSINMCRLQESDSLSENETAPEPPPRPDSVLHVEPPPLPPKKQFNEIVIRPRVTSGNAVPPRVAPATVNSRYEFVNTTAKNVRATNVEVPPIPLPSRRVGRSDGTYPGPGRPRKPGHTEDDYLAPISVAGSIGSGSVDDVPPLLPPPTQTSTRNRAQRQQSLSKSQDIYENKMEILQQQQQQQQLQQNRHQTLSDTATETNIAAPLIPDITLSQLMTLSLDDLAIKLNVPVSKLSTMTLVELTSYLSEFIEKSKPQRVASASISEQTLTSHLSPLPTRRIEKSAIKAELSVTPAQAPVFKVNFDQQATFVAKFDDTFGEDFGSHPAEEHGQDAFANFEQFNEPPAGPAPILSETGLNAPIVPPADRYAAFREIIDKELQEQQENADLIGEEITENDPGGIVAADVGGMAVVSDDLRAHFEANFDDDDFLTGSKATIATGDQQTQPPKIDTKITEVVAQAKDRYAALRDIILVENLFDNKSPVALQASQEFPEFSDEFNEDQDQDLKHIMDGRVSSSGPDRLGLVDSRGLPAEPSSSALTVDDDDDDDDGGGESSIDSNDKDAEVAGDTQDKYEKLSTSTQQLDGEKSDKLDMNGSLPERSASQPSPNLLSAKQDNKFLTVACSSGLSSSKDDLEIDELMQRAISNLSLDSRERFSPANSASNMPTVIVTSGSSIALPRPNATLSTQAQFNDVSTSPIPLQKSPTPGAVQQQQKSPLRKSPQASPVLSQLSAVSNLIDTATKQMNTGGKMQQDTEVKHSKEFWATFDSPKPSIEKIDKRARGPAKSTIKTSSLHLPPPPPSNTSQNDTAESPCSSDPRDDGWSKGGGVGRRWPKKDRHHTSSSSRDLSPWDDELSDFQKQKRIPGVGPAVQPPSTAHVSDRHAYYMRHTRRMNSCDEDYDYEEEFNTRRDHRKLKPGLSRSRDNFDLESPSWYPHAPHHTWSPQDIEHAASMRARAFDRSAYERTTYGPPVYDKRGVALPPNASSSYDRRSGYDKRSKYYRDYARPNYDFDDYVDRYRDAGTFEKPKSGRRADYENIYDDGRSPLSGGGGGVGSYKGRAVDYMYDRERKSFDRDSVESFESANRRRRSFGSGDVYGSMESHEDFRERYVPEKSRSLRKSIKLRTTGDIDYEQDSESDFRTRMGSGANIMNVTDTRSLQRPNQLNSAGGSSAMVGAGRARKSSGSSPWDGEEPQLTGQKSWKRPSSAADSERRLAESRRVVALGQTPSGSDGEKDRRFRKKQRSRGKDSQYSNSVAPNTTAGRYGSTVSAPPPHPHPRDNYDYITYDDDVDDDEEDYADEDYDEPPTDEDKFERLNRRRHEMNQRMLESERRQHSMGKVSISSLKCSAPITTTKKYPTRGGEYDFDDYEQSPTPRSNASGCSLYLPPTSGGGVGCGISVGSATKFSFDGGFESDFNQSSPPPAPAGTASSCNSTPAATTTSACVTPATKSSFRFSNDFSERDKLTGCAQNSSSVASSQQQLDMDSTHSLATHAIPPIITQKLRFDDNVKVSQFDDAAFEDDFSNAQFDFEKEDQWHADSLQSVSSGALMSASAKKHNLRNSKLQQRQELIKKSESINIFAKKAEDPFEDDEFFKAPTDAKLANINNNNNGQQLSKLDTGNSKSGGVGGSGGLQCDDDFNFAKFDENM